jgi:hypothetical protein
MKDWMKERMEFSERLRANQREQAEQAFDQYEFDAKVKIGSLMGRLTSVRER